MLAHSGDTDDFAEGVEALEAAVAAWHVSIDNTANPINAIAQIFIFISSFSVPNFVDSQFPHRLEEQGRCRRQTRSNSMNRIRAKGIDQNLFTNVA
jgi:hypothetical protein